MASANIFALDLGTTKFCVARLKGDSKNAHLAVESVSIDAEGMHRGMLSDLNSASQALNTLLSKAEDALGVDIRRVAVGVAGSHLAGKTVTSKIRINQNEGSIVDPALIDRLKDQVICDQRSPVREVLHCIPIGYRLDGRCWIKSPAGFSGDFLHGRFFLMEADKHYLSDIVQLCNGCGLEVSSLFAEPFASAAVTSREESKKVGLAVADIGGGTTDGIIFLDNLPVASFTLNVAGRLMTKDLSVGLGLSLREAEKVKRHFGVSPSNAAEGQDIARGPFPVNPLELSSPTESQIRSPSLSGSPLKVIDLNGVERNIGFDDVYPILGARIDELGEMLETCLGAYREKLGGGLFLTGGGSEVEGISSFLEARLGCRVTRSTPVLPDSLLALSYSTENTKKPRRSISSCSGSITSSGVMSNDRINPRLATVTGLLFLEAMQISKDRSGKRNGTLSRYFGRFMGWLKELS